MEMVHTESKPFQKSSARQHPVQPQSYPPTSFATRRKREMSDNSTHRPFRRFDSLSASVDESPPPAAISHCCERRVPVQIITHFVSHISCAIFVLPFYDAPASLTPTCILFSHLAVATLMGSG
ncbi:hypothetical protein WUBG_08512 [Wuchereria bancrofti]|nr:hypothetical protein WUBG_08512 [Wuchereria bancrofti]